MTDEEIAKYIDMLILALKLLAERIDGLQKRIEELEKGDGEHDK